MERVSIFCDAWPVRRQIYGYLLPLRRGTNLYRFVVEDYGELLAQGRAAGKRDSRAGAYARQGGHGGLAPNSCMIVHN